MRLKANVRPRTVARKTAVADSIDSINGTENSLESTFKFPACLKGGGGLDNQNL